jgi:hypothetical protein
LANNLQLLKKLAVGYLKKTVPRLRCYKQLKAKISPEVEIKGYFYS